jgi:hypothetical protein
VTEPDLLDRLFETHTRRLVMAVREKLFVTFVSPGTFFAETSTKEIDSESPQLACRMAREVTERYNATPYSFVFITKLVSDPVDDGRGGKLHVDSREIRRSGNYFITGELKRFDDILETDKTRTLLSNMRCNDYPIVVENRNSFLATLPFASDDVIVDWDGNITQRGDDPELVAYRQQKTADFKRYYETALAK